MKWQRLQKIFFIVFLVLTFGSLLIYQIYGGDLDLEKIRIYLQSFGIWAPLIFILLYIFGAIFIPSTPFMIASGILFGFKYGFIYAIFSGFSSSIIVFTISRKLGQERVANILENKYLKYLNKYNKRLESGAIGDIIILRMVPIMPINILNILMGVSKIKTRDYIVGTFLGLIPSNILTVYFGSFITEIL